MPQFRYTATTPEGQRVEGTSEAAQWQDVDQALQSRGFKLTGIAEIAASQAPPVASKTVVAQPVAKAPDVRASPPPSSRRPAAIPVAVQTTKKTRYATDKDLFFLFSQIGSYLKSGVNPAQAYENLSKSMSQSKFAGALQDLSRAASNGLSVASEMARYPYLFPPHVVGAYRAGEVGGFLPETCLMLSEQANNSHRFKRWFFWLGVFFVGLLFSIPAINWGARGLLGIWDKAEAAGGNLDGFAAMRQSFGEELVRTAPFSLGFTAVVVLGYLAWKSMRNRRLRHKLALIVPTTGKRARLESMAVFSWALSRLFKIGMAPKSAVEHAAAAMPNLELAGQMARAAAGMRNETKLSEVADQVSMLTPEMKSIVMTGEYVGDLPGALSNVAQAHKAEFNSLDQTSRVRIGCWMLVVVIGGSLLAGGIFQKMFYDGMIDRILGE